MLSTVGATNYCTILERDMNRLKNGPQIRPDRVSGYLSHTQLFRKMAAKNE